MRFLCYLILGCLPVLPASAAPPAAPSDLVVTPTSTTSLTLTWKDNASDETGFELSYHVGTSGGFTVLNIPIAFDTQSLPLSGASPGTTYQFRLRARNAVPEYSAYAGPATGSTLGITGATYRAAYLNQGFAGGLTATNPSLVTGYAITALPAGLSLNPTTGAITGTPVTFGKVTGQASVAYSNGVTATGTLTFNIFTNPPAPAAPVAAPALPDLTLTNGTTPAPISLTGFFTDPDVTSAARLTTDLGNLDFAFMPGAAPLTVANFLDYLTTGKFLNTIFHRSVPGFIIQAGAFRADATASTVPTSPAVVNEPKITNLRGTVAMAKLGGNPNSATNQFFINLGNNAGNLDNQNEGFTVFARIAGNGMSVADAIAALPVRSYTAINGALTDTPIRGTPPVSYNPDSLVRISASTVIDPITVTVATSPPGIVNAAVTGSGPTLALAMTPLLSGQTIITLTATDLDHQSTTSTFNVTLLDTFPAWAARQSFATPADALAESDPDHDGKSNLIEYALGTLATTSDPPPNFEILPRLPGQPLQLHAFPAPYQTPLLWKAQFSDNLNFTPAADATPVTGSLPAPVGTPYLEFTDPDPTPHANRFSRLKVSLP